EFRRVLFRSGLFRETTTQQILPCIYPCFAPQLGCKVLCRLIEQVGLFSVFHLSLRSLRVKTKVRQIEMESFRQVFHGAHEVQALPALHEVNHIATGITLGMAMPAGLTV